ncbi:hypothetical protein ADH66_11745 [Acutalibacter muris]|uniref:Transposase DDE domain-containing protein n=1 Tax=Acutalibacter muris TaxID=1796620 RepID=A0ABM6L797_9FIRM|nr:hypothetical protein A4V00_16570 [Hungateiclostridiaceae bacterium KB18]ASB41268.1 hypothetical protein ADH66_11745 [Acutalibacter muris]
MWVTVWVKTESEESQAKPTQKAELDFICNIHFGMQFLTKLDRQDYLDKYNKSPAYFMQGFVNGLTMLKRCQTLFRGQKAQYLCGFAAF